MAYTSFSSDRADYILDLGNHFYNRRNDEIFNGIDALVLESGDVSPNQILNGSEVLGNKRLIDNCAKNNTLIYFVDYHSANFSSGFLREIIGNIIEFPILPILIYHCLSRKKTNDFLGRFYSDYIYVLQNPLSEGRNAIAARKIEEFVINYYKKSRKKLLKDAEKYHYIAHLVKLLEKFIRN